MLLGPIAQEPVQCSGHRASGFHLWSPADIPKGIPDTWAAMLDIFIALAVIASAFNDLESCEWREVLAKRMRLELFHQHLGKFLDAVLVIGISDVDDSAVTTLFFVLDDAEETVNAFGHFCEASLLLSTVHELDRRSLNQIQNQLSDRTG